MARVEPAAPGALASAATVLSSRPAPVRLADPPARASEVIAGPAAASPNDGLASPATLSTPASFALTIAEAAPTVQMSAAQMSAVRFAGPPAPVSFALPTAEAAPTLQMSAVRVADPPAPVFVAPESAYAAPTLQLAAVDVAVPAGAPVAPSSADAPLTVQMSALQVPLPAVAGAPHLEVMAGLRAPVPGPRLPRLDVGAPRAAPGDVLPAGASTLVMAAWTPSDAPAPPSPPLSPQPSSAAKPTARPPISAVSTQIDPALGGTLDISIDVIGRPTTCPAVPGAAWIWAPKKPGTCCEACTNKLPASA
jgi:hypothetical protein